ncbi:MAG: hypothetical protein JO166_24410 [Deltaproteobacteria bacterium]|nr:hypothetical protein [Deltaproteobacteria bacterium]
MKRVRELELRYQRPKPLQLTVEVQWRGITVEDVDRLAEAGVERVLPSGLVARDSLGALRRVHEALESKFLQR